MAEKLGEFFGKKALVTGAGKGIGRATAKALHAAGAEVWGVSRTQSDLDSLVLECPGLHAVCVDLGDWDATRAALTPLPVMDCLVNNAGIGKLTSFLDVTKEEFDNIMSVNCTAVFNVAQIVTRAMVAASRPGAVVNVSSVASLGALDQHFSYCTSKGAVDQQTRVMALELGPHKIRVNAVNPTVVLTDLGRMAWSDPARANPVLARIPLKRFAELEDVVDPILFLLSERSSMITGNVLPIEGGFRCH